MQRGITRFRKLYDRPVNGKQLRDGSSLGDRVPYGGEHADPHLYRKHCHGPSDVVDVIAVDIEIDRIN